MNRLDRILDIVLQLRSHSAVTAADLAEQYAVSRRTIYRDIETLSLLGVPIYTVRGRGGGIRLLEGYFLPPLMFSTREAVSLLLGLTFVRNMAHKPFPADLVRAEQKLLAAMPDRLRTLLQDAQRIVNFEEFSENDIFHPEPDEWQAPNGSVDQVITLFLQAILDRKRARLDYKSPYGEKASVIEAAPLGMFWDRNRWYLVGKPGDQADGVRLWRADRVEQIQLAAEMKEDQSNFDVRSLLGHSWLGSAMSAWRQEAPVKIQLSLVQADRLRKDWYYRHAHFEAINDEQVIMTFGEDNRETVLALLRWLGPGATLVEPESWRALAIAELQQMLDDYQ